MAIALQPYFNQDIRPILSNRCFKCHGPDLQKGGLDLQTFETATKKLDDGEPAFVPGDAAKSDLIRAIHQRLGKSTTPAS